MVQSRKKKTDQEKTKDGASETGGNVVSTESRTVSGGETPADNAAVDEVEDYAIFLLDTDGKILSWNKGAEKIKGYKASEIIGKNYRIFYTPEDKALRLSEKLLNEARQKGRIIHEGWRVRQDGTRFWGSIALTALHSDGGSVRGFIKVTRDLTERKIEEDKYSNYVEDLRQKNEELKRSEERYKQMIDEVQDYAIILLDPVGTIVDWNKGAEKLTGYKSSEIIGKSFRLFHPREEKDLKVPEKLLEEAIEKGSVVQEGWRIGKHGNRFWGNVTITALHGQGGEIIGFSKFTRDFTKMKIADDRMGIILEELKQANEQLRRSEERYQRMISEVQDYAIILLDREGNIENWNTGAALIKGYDAQEIIGKNIRVFYSDEDRRNRLPESLLQQAYDKGKATHEGWRIRKDGSRFWGSIVITALHDSSGEVIGYSKVTRDLTERKNAEDLLRLNSAQLDLKNKTLERLNEELSSFTHIASHDMKEPLRKIQTYVARIESAGFDAEKSREFLQKIKASAAGMQNLIDDLLSYSQLTSETIHNFERTDLNVTMQTVLSDLEISIHEKQALVDFRPLPVVRGVPHQLHQLFLNLVSNALKFSKADELPHIEIVAEVIKGPHLPGLHDGDNNYHHITVIDNGIGFPHEAADRIFEPFQRLHPRSVFSGTGIGLAIVKRIIDHHNGIISAEGRPGVGAVFHIYLPV